MFRFKQFAIDDSRSSMKVGTDGVLLGAWCDAGGGRSLDIGTGSGVIALMLAQRNAGARVDAVDMDEGSVADARANAAGSPWGDRIEVILCPLQEFAPGTFYDRIVSNPPYFVDSLLPPDKGRELARHTTSLSFRQLAEGVSRLLGPEGLFSLILPPAEARSFTEEALEAGLRPRRRTDVRSTAGTPVGRVLMEFGRCADSMEVSELFIEGPGGGFTAEYMALTRDFYLKF